MDVLQGLESKAGLPAVLLRASTPGLLCLCLTHSRYALEAGVPGIPKFLLLAFCVSHVPTANSSRQEGQHQPLSTASEVSLGLLVRGHQLPVFPGLPLVHWRAVLGSWPLCVAVLASDAWCA